MTDLSPPRTKKLHPALQKALDDAVYHAQNTEQIDQVARMLSKGDIEGSLRAIGLDPTDYTGFEKEIAAALDSRPESQFVRYDRDLYSWAIEQAALLRAGRISEADALNIAEEIDDVGNEQYDKLESALRMVLVHILKWDHQPSRRSRSWHLSVMAHRRHVLKVLRKNPGLKSVRDEAVVEAYEDARIEAADQTLLELDVFPHDCPYSWNDIMERPITWPPAD